MGTRASFPQAGSKPPLVLIAGPTASGKSAAALRYGEALAASGGKAVIINADSAQVYRDLHILSARPGPAEERRLPHRLYGAWDGAAPCTAADWAAAARREIALAHEQGAVPVLVGGTGLYLKVLLEGIAPIPPIDLEIRARVRALSQEDARAALASEDPDSAARLAPADRSRTLRALETVRSTGRTIGHWRERRSGGIGEGVSLDAHVLMPDRDRLYRRCDRRVVAMIENGAVEEVAALLDRGLDPALPVMRAIGVAPLTAFLRGGIELDEAIAQTQAATRRYAKRQFTWFRNQMPKHWHRFPSANGQNGETAIIFPPR
jgi:tRNA dimethylallyltransferase